MSSIIGFFKKYYPFTGTYWQEQLEKDRQMTYVPLINLEIECINREIRLPIYMGSVYAGALAFNGMDNIRCFRDANFKGSFAVCIMVSVVYGSYKYYNHLKSRERALIKIRNRKVEFRQNVLDNMLLLDFDDPDILKELALIMAKGSFSDDLNISNNDQLGPDNYEILYTGFLQIAQEIKDNAANHLINKDEINKELEEKIKVLKSNFEDAVAKSDQYKKLAIYKLGVDI